MKIIRLHDEKNKQILINVDHIVSIDRKGIDGDGAKDVVRIITTGIYYYVKETYSDILALINSEE